MLSFRPSHEGLNPSERQEIEMLDPLYYWPDDQLARHLINLYVSGFHWTQMHVPFYSRLAPGQFEHVNVCYPLLHLPTFLQ